MSLAPSLSGILPCSHFFFLCSSSFSFGRQGGGGLRHCHWRRRCHWPRGAGPGGGCGEGRRRQGRGRLRGGKEALVIVIGAVVVRDITMLTLLLPLFLFIFIWQARNDGAMVLNGKSDPRDTTHPAVKMHTLTDFQLYVQNMDRSVTFLGSPGEERHTHPANRRFGWMDLTRVTLTERRARLFLFLINLNFYRQRLNNTRYLFGARLLFLQYYIVHVCF